MQSLLEENERSIVLMHVGDCDAATAFAPTLDEILVCLGIWAFGLLLYTIFVRITIPVLSGRLTIDRTYHFSDRREVPSTTGTTAKG